MKKRIDQLIKALGISGRAFSAKIGKSSAFVSTIKDNVGADVLTNILNIYPEVNPRWLLTGEEEMFLTEKTVTPYPQNDSFSMAAASGSEYGKDNYKEMYINELEKRIALLERIIEDKDKMIENKDILLESFRDGRLIYVKKGRDN